MIDNVTLTEINNLLNINLWNVPSFRATVQIDFDEFGNVLNAEVIENIKEVDQ